MPRRKPPKKYIKGKVVWMRRFLGRVTEIKEGNYCINLWPQWKASLVTEFHEVIHKKTKWLTVSGKIQSRDPVEVWSWCENIDGVETKRMHMKKLT